MRSIPAFGIMPQLVHLNVSFNSFQSIAPQQFSPFCSLKDVAIETDIERENGTLMGPCMCTTLQAYFMRRRINVRDSFDCSKTHESKASRNFEENVLPIHARAHQLESLLFV